MYAAARIAAVLEFGAGESRRVNPRGYIGVLSAFTIGCASTDTLEHTLSAMELFSYFHAK